MAHIEMFTDSFQGTPVHEMCSGKFVPGICRFCVLKSAHTFLSHLPGVNGKCKINKILIWL